MSSTPLAKSACLADSELRDLLLQYRRQNWARIQTPQWQERIVDCTLHDDGQAIFEPLAGFWHISPCSRVLDIGSGVGSFVLACRRRGIAAFGIEPDRIGRGAHLTSIQIARRRTQDSAFVSAVGERLPFLDRSFDLVCMNQVMEHVDNQIDVLREAVRVLRLGGVLYVASPNYLRFYEPHYKIFWIPLLPKWLGSLYLRARGRDPVLLYQLVYTTNSRLRALFREFGAELRVVDPHREQFLNKCEHGGFLSKRAQLASKLMKVPGLGPIVKWAALAFLSATEGGCEMLAIRNPNSLDPSC